MKKKVRIESDKVRVTCIKQNWYTMGSCEAYENLLLNLCDKEDASDDDIMAVVNDIAEHTNIIKMSKDYGLDSVAVIENIAFYIYNDCITTFIEL